MAASMRVILSTKATWAVENDADVVENVRTASMMARKSRVEIVIYYGGGAEVLGPATSAGAVVLGAEGFGGTGDAGAVGSEAVAAGAGGGDAGT